MKISTYTPLFNVIEKNFDYKGALANWATFADEISLAVNTSPDGTFETLRDYARFKGYPVSIVQTNFDYSDPFCYGKIENAALQNTTGDLLIQQNLDERFMADPKVLMRLWAHMQRNPHIKAFFVPVINLYGSNNHYTDIAAKWYIHGRGLFRGPVHFGLKEDGRPDYNKTSTDELIDENHQLVLTHKLFSGDGLEDLADYVSKGMPLVYHLGYVDLKDRAARAKWWKEFWNNATGGDENTHTSSIEELEKRHTKPHGLPLWKE